MFFVADKPNIVADALGNLRLHLGKQLDLIDETQYNFLWIVDYPLFEWNEEENRYEPFHHLFTGCTEETLPLLDTDPGNVQSQHYDLVCNGYEICSGSVRIHQWDVQQKVFDILEITPEDVESRFGYFIDRLGVWYTPTCRGRPRLRPDRHANAQRGKHSGSYRVSQITTGALSAHACSV